MHLLTLIVGIVLLPKAYSLRCYECFSSTGTCTDAETQCPASNYQCAAVRVATFAAGSRQSELTGKTCALPEDCVSGSVNFGVYKTALSSSCCTTDLCNNQPAPGISSTKPNGKKCFTCNGQTKQCTATLNCEGTEDHCVSATVTVGSEKNTIKGCVSKQFCSSSQSSKMFGSLGTDFSCCQGDYCNSGSSLSAGLLLLVAPLIYFIVFS